MTQAAARLRHGRNGNSDATPQLTRSLTWISQTSSPFRQGDVGIVRGADAALRVECVGVRGIAACCSQEVGVLVARPSGKQ